jgi:hypothetical protein
MKTLVINLSAAEIFLSGRGLFKCFTYVREIKSVCKLAMKRVIVFCNGVHLSPLQTGNPTFRVAFWCIGYLEDIKYAM